MSASDHAIPAPGPRFDSSAWVAYFKRNSLDRQQVESHETPALDSSLIGPLIASLQRFQIGESGDGRHLISAARATGDPEYMEAIKLFVAEEQDHARWLAAVIERLGGMLLDSHWSDRVFVIIRRMMGLRTELMVLLIAELIARRYYRAIYDGTSDPAIRAMCEQIMIDELGHVRFHFDYLRHGFSTTPGWARTCIHVTWTAAFRATCLVVLIDHRKALRACNVSLETFWHDCGLILSDASTRIFGNQDAARQFLLERA